MTTVMGSGTSYNYANGMSVDDPSSNARASVLYGGVDPSLSGSGWTLPTQVAGQQHMPAQVRGSASQFSGQQTTSQADSDLSSQHIPDHSVIVMRIDDSSLTHWNETSTGHRLHSTPATANQIMDHMKDWCSWAITNEGVFTDSQLRNLINMSVQKFQNRLGPQIVPSSEWDACFDRID